jgi:hypothetical protein
MKGIALQFILCYWVQIWNVTHADNLIAIYEPTASTTHNPIDLLLRDSFIFLYVDDVRTSQETPVGIHGLLRGELYSFICT